MCETGGVVCLEETSLQMVYHTLDHGKHPLPFLICCCLRFQVLWTSCTEASTQSDVWHGKQDSGQVEMALTLGRRTCGPHSVWYTVTTVLRSWNTKEGWEDMNGSLASMEKALQVLAERLPDRIKVLSSMWAICYSPPCVVTWRTHLMK